MSFYQDSPFMLAVGGSKGVLALWDTSENQGVERKFSGRVSTAGTAAASSDISASFKSAYDLGEELAMEEEREREQAKENQKPKGKKKNKGKKK